MPTDAPIQIRDATGALVYVDNEQVDNEAGLGVRRQLVGAPDIEGVLQAIRLHLSALNAKAPQPNPVTAAGRVEVLSGTLATVTASTTRATVTRSTTEAHIVSTTYVKRLGDTLPVFSATLTRDGAAVNLTAATVTLRYWPRGATTSTTKTMTVTDATAGVAEYAWAANEPAAEGVYDFVVEAVLSTGDPLSFPNGNGWGTFTVTPAPPGA